MNKKIISALLAAILAAVAVVSSWAYTPDQQRAADALNELGLFLGKGGDAGYALDDSLNRMEGITLLVRMIGKESEAKAGTYNVPFTDVTTPENNWSEPYVGYAYANKITDGYGDGIFGAKDAMTDYMFLTLTLRALGYSDKGDAPQFTWDNPYALAEDVGLIADAEADDDFLRGDAVSIFWNAMSAKCANSEDTLVDTLIEAGVFSAAKYETAKDIFKNGRTESADTGTSEEPIDTSTEPETDPPASTPASTPEETTVTPTAPEETTATPTTPQETLPPYIPPVETDPDSGETLWDPFETLENETPIG